MDDRRKYIAALVEKTGVRIDEDDPIFAVVLLNQIIMEEKKTELENVLGQMVKFGANIRGEVIKQVEAQCNAKLLQLQTDAAGLRTNLEREHASWREATKEALRQEIGGAARAIQTTRESIMQPVWTAAIVSGVASGLVVAAAMWLLG